jgi:ABC-type sugar transport system permease subunit
MRNKVKSRLQKQNEITGFLLTVPAFVFILGVATFALFWALLQSFNTNVGILTKSFHFTGFTNYVKVLARREIYDVLGRTFLYAFSTVIIEIFLGLAISLCLWFNIKGTGIFKVCISLPLMIAPIVSGMVWKWIFTDRYGILNHFLSFFGIKGPYWLGSAGAAKAAILIVSVWGAAPFAILVLLAGISGISNDIIESARIDGADGLTLYRKIIFPFLRPAISMIMLIRIADALKTFDIVRMLTEGGPGDATRLLSYHIYSRAFNNTQFAESAAGSWMAFFIIAAITFISSTLVWRRAKIE